MNSTLATLPNSPAHAQEHSALPMRLEVLGAAQRTAAMGIWRSLEDDLSHTRLTSSSVWTQTWVKARMNKPVYDLVKAGMARAA